LRSVLGTIEANKRINELEEKLETQMAEATNGTQETDAKTAKKQQRGGNRGKHQENEESLRAEGTAEAA
jgi:hypothetical protein